MALFLGKNAMRLATIHSGECRKMSDDLIKRLRERSEEVLHDYKDGSRYETSNDDAAVLGSELIEAANFIEGASVINESLFIEIEKLWEQVKPSGAAQRIMSRLSTAFDSEKSKDGWLGDNAPDYVWSLVDIAAQWGIDYATPREMSWEDFQKRFPHKGPTPELRAAAAIYFGKKKP